MGDRAHLTYIRSWEGNIVGSSAAVIRNPAYAEDGSEVLISKATWSLKLSGMLFAGLLILGRSASYGNVTWTPTLHPAGSPLIVTINSHSTPKPVPSSAKGSDPAALSKRSAAAEVVAFDPGNSGDGEDGHNGGSGDSGDNSHDQKSQTNDHDADANGSGHTAAGSGHGSGAGTAAHASSTSAKGSSGSAGASAAGPSSTRAKGSGGGGGGAAGGARRSRGPRGGGGGGGGGAGGGKSSAAREG